MTTAQQWWGVAVGVVLLATFALAAQQSTKATRLIERRLDQVTRELAELRGLVEPSAATNDQLRRSIDGLTERSRVHAQSLSSEISSLERALKSSTFEVGDLIEASRKDLAEQIRVFTQGILEEVAENRLQAQRSHRTQERHLDHVSQEIQGLVGLYSSLKPQRPYPQFGGWALSADAARRLVTTVFSRSPNLIVDIGSGVSTLLEAQTLAHLNKGGRVIALDHDPEWAQVTRELLREHGVDHLASVVTAPLVRYTINGNNYQWYDLSEVDFDEPIDLLFIDGPPKAVGPLARYPALPLLEPHLSSRAIILLDDARRPDEKESIRLWLHQYPGWSLTIHSDEKGTAELIRTGK